MPHATLLPSEGKKEMPHRPPGGSGSGVIIDKTGFIITNGHVVGEENKVKVQLADKTEYTGVIVGRDVDTDLAVVKIVSEKELPFVALGDSKKVEVGQWVVAVGNPFGLDRTVTIGIVSGLGRENINLSRYENFIQTDASINPGNSGGPLFNIQGQVIGINTAIINVAQGIGFAIPSNMVQTISQQLIQQGKVTRGWLGVGIQPLTSELAKKFNVKEEEGILVNEVFKGDPADLGGILPGDIILKVEEEGVGTTNTLARVIAGYAPEARVTIEFIRNGERQKRTLQLGEKKDEGAVTAALPKKPELFVGLTVQSITEESVKEFNLKEDKGIVVTNVLEGSAGESEGLKKGDLIKEIEGEKITDLSEFKKLTEKVKKTESVLLRMSRENRAFYVVLKQLQPQEN
jgi:serine protease Do